MGGRRRCPSAEKNRACHNLEVPTVCASVTVYRGAGSRVSARRRALAARAQPKPVATTYPDAKPSWLRAITIKPF